MRYHCLLLVRKYSTKLLFSLGSAVAKGELRQQGPARTRFAPSPTGFLHLGSLRTALYNYLLAKATKGVFILRLEDTDQKRLVPGLEQSIYETLNWLGLKYDEGPIVGGDHSPYRQSDRTDIYLRHVKKLLDEGKLYRCFCSKERLDSLRQSALSLKPPTTVSYDRHCLHSYSPEESALKLRKGDQFTIRFISPDVYPSFHDLLHGEVNLQPQIDHTDRRFDDLILLKSDNLPTYHLANVIDDHLMEVTHVIRGEEWLPSTPKHLALYSAFNWPAPSFVHIPLLTSIEGDKKLSKRSGDIDIMSLKSKGYLKEALLNFCVLFGWSPKRLPNETVKEIFSLKDLEQVFSLEQLTKGNAKVDFKKLGYFNKHYLTLKLTNDQEFFDNAVKEVKSRFYPDVTEEYISKVLKEIGPSLVTLNDVQLQRHSYLFKRPDFHTEECQKFIELTGEDQICGILNRISGGLQEGKPIHRVITETAENYKQKKIYQSVRFALSGLTPGLKLPELIELLGKEETITRLEIAIKYVS